MEKLVNIVNMLIQVNIGILHAIIIAKCLMGFFLMRSNNFNIHLGCIGKSTQEMIAN